MILGAPTGDVSIATLRRVAQPRAFRSGLGLGRSDSLSGANVSRDDAMSLPPFWSGVMLLAKTAGTLPLEVRDEMNANQVVAGSDVSLRLRRQWNVDTPASVALTTLFTHLIPTHNAFALKLPANDGLKRSPELFLIEPELVEKYRDADGVVRYDLYSRDGSEFARQVHGRHVLHFRGPSLRSTFRPDSMISVARNALGNALATQQYQGAMYRNGGVPKGVLSVDEPLTLEQGIEMADAWRAAYGGIDNAGKIAVLDRGGKFQTVAMNNEHAQFVEQLQLSATDAARLLNIPPAFIGAEGSAMTYDNASSNNIHLLTYALRPWLDLVEAALNMDPDYFGLRSPWVPRFNTDEITRPDQSARYVNYATAIAAGWMTPDEPRVLEGLPPMTAGAAGTARSMDAAHNRSTDHATPSMQMPNITINQPAVSVQPPDVRNEITVQPSAAPTVHVAAPDVRVEPQIMVGEQPAPTVVVNVPEQQPPNVQVDVAAPNVQVDVAPADVRVEPQIMVDVPPQGGNKSVKFERNRLGNIIDATITESE